MKKKESYLAKKTGITEAYLNHLDKQTDEQLLVEYSYYASSVSNAETILKSAIFVACGIVIAIAINYGVKIISWSISNKMTRSEINSIIYLVLVIWIVTGILVVGSLKISFDSLTQKRARFVYLEQYLIRKGLLNR